MARAGMGENVEMCCSRGNLSRHGMRAVERMHMCNSLKGVFRYSGESRGCRHGGERRGAYNCVESRA